VEWLRLIGICLLSGVLVMLLRQLHPAMAALLCAVFGVMVVAAVLPDLRSYVVSIRDFLLSLGLDGQYYTVMLKAMGIVLVTQIASQVCRDMDAPSVAQRAELCGRLALLGIVMPVFLSLTQMAVDVLR